jgi:hypothetical protein
VLARFAPGVSWLWWPRGETGWLVGAFVAMLALLAALPGLF